jgi:hypothetical protein
MRLPFKSVFWNGLLISLIFILVYFYSFLPNLDKPIELARGDSFHIVLTLRHYMDVFTQGRWDDLLTLPMFYGFKDSLLFSELMPLQAILALPIYLLSHNIIITFNVLVLLTEMLSFLSMFLLVHYLTKQYLPAILGAVIFVFNPFTLGHFPDNLVHISIEWIPLIFLYFEKFIDKQKKLDGFLFFLFLTFNLLSTVSYTAILSVIFPIYFGIRLWQKRLNPLKLINSGVVGGLILFSITVGALGYVYLSLYPKGSMGRNLMDTTMFAPWFSDLLFSPPNNLIYGGLRSVMLDLFPDLIFQNLEHIERNLFWGIVPTILFWISFFMVLKSKFKKLWVICISLMLLCLILSFGPLIHFTSDIALPGLYSLVYKLHPFIQNMRVSSRFYILNYLFLGLICSFVMVKFSTFLNPKNYKIF